MYIDMPCNCSKCGELEDLNNLWKCKKCDQMCCDECFDTDERRCNDCLEREND